MPPATEPIPVLILDNLATALRGINGGTDYYHTVTGVEYARDLIREEYPGGYPAIFIGEPGQVGDTDQPADTGVMWHGTWHWHVPVFGVIRDVGGGTESYRALLRFVADIYRAVVQDYQRGQMAYSTEVLGWTMVGPQEETDGRPWVAVTVRIKFNTKDTNMVSQ